MNEIFRCGFFGSITELTHMRRHHKIEALATDICAAAWQAVKSNIGQRCFIDVLLQHPSADRPFRTALLSHRFLNNMRYHKNNTEPEKSGHFLTVTQYLKESWNYTMTCAVKVCLLYFFPFLAIGSWLASIHRVGNAHGRLLSTTEP